ncbi:MAG: membrane fusion protein (multidrug efflux system), partial [Saprospiraceae bacterium]
MNPTTRKITLIVLAIAATFIGVKIVKSFAPEKKESTAKSVLKSVRTIQITPSTHKAQVTFSGKVGAYQKIDVSSEVSGVLLNDNFRTGNSFKKGQTIVQLNAQEFENNVKSAKSQLSATLASSMGDIKVDHANNFKQWNDFLSKLKVGKPLPELPETGEKLKNFLSGKGIYKQYYGIKSQEDKLSKFTITAPYDGMVIQSSINKGAVVRAGQKIGTFANGQRY